MRLRRYSLLLSLLLAFLFLNLIPEAHAIDIKFSFQWDANHPNDNVETYRIYWRSESGDFNETDVEPVPVTGLSDPDNPQHTFRRDLTNPISTIYYACTAVDDEGFESNYSNEVAFGIAGSSPAYGHIDGGQTVTINGAGFQYGASVYFGDYPGDYLSYAGTDVNFISSNKITCVIPAHDESEVDIVVVNPDGAIFIKEGGFGFVTFAILLGGNKPYLVTSGSNPSSLTMNAAGGSSDSDYSWTWTPQIGTLNAIYPYNKAIFYAPASITSSVVTTTIILENLAGTLSDEQDITIYRPVNITDPTQKIGLTNVSTASAGRPNSYTLKVTGGTWSYTYTPSSSDIWVNSSTGLLKTTSNLGNFNVIVTDSTHGDTGTNNGFKDVMYVQVVEPIEITNIPTYSAMQTSRSQNFNSIGGTGANAVTWSVRSGGGSINSSTGDYTAPSSPGTVTIRATDSTYSNIYTEITITVYSPVKITNLPVGYSASNPDTYPLVAGEGTTMDVNATGGPPAVGVIWTVIDSDSNTVPGAINSNGIVYADVIFDYGGAGVYTVIAEKTDYFSKPEMKIRIPMRIIPLTGVYDDGTSTTFTVEGQPGALIWYVTDLDGTINANQTFASFSANTLDAHPDQADNLFSFSDDITHLTTFRVLVESNDPQLVDAGIDTVITDKHQIVIAVIEYAYVQVNNADTGEGVSGVTVTATYNQDTYVGVTDLYGLAILEDLRNTGVTYRFNVVGPDSDGKQYVPVIFSASDVSAPITDPMTIELTEILVGYEGTVSGTVSLDGDNTGNEGVIVSIFPEAEVPIDDDAIYPEVLADNDTGSYTLAFDTLDLGVEPYIVMAEKFGYVTNIDDEAGILSGVTYEQSGIDIDLQPATKITILDDYDDVRNATINFSILAQPPFQGFGTSPDEIKVFQGTSSNGTDVTGSLTYSDGVYEYSVSTPSEGTSLNIYVQADTSTSDPTPRDADFGYFGTRTHTILSGVTIVDSVVTVIDNTNAGGSITLDSGAEADLPPGGVDTLESVTLTIKQIGPIDTVFGPILPFIVELTYTATGEPVPKELINRLYLTIKFEPKTVPPGSLKSGKRVIFFASSLLNFADERFETITRDQIMTVNYVTGELIFWVDHLSIFWVGGSPETYVTTSGSCFIGTAIDQLYSGIGVFVFSVLLALSALCFIIKKRRSI